MEANVAIWVLANGEMTLDLVVRYISQFRNPHLKKEFMERTFNYSLYKLIPHNDEVEAELGELTLENGDFCTRLKTTLHQALDTAGEGSKGLLCTGILKDVKRAIR